MPVLVVVLMLLSSPLLANVDVGEESFSSGSLTNAIRYLEDSHNRFSLQDVLTIQPNDWKRNSDRIFSKGYSSSSWWFKISLTNPSPASFTRFLEIGYPILDHIQVFIVEGGQSTMLRLGDTLPFSQRPILSNNYVIPIQFSSYTSLDVYIRVNTHSALQMPLTLWKKQDYYSWDRIENLVQGFYFGVMAVMTLYNLFVFIAVRERNFLLYVCFACTLPMFIAGLKGFSFAYFWPNHPQFNDYAIIIPLCLALLFGAMFTESFLKIKKLGHWATSIFRVQKSVILVLLLLSFFMSYRIIINILIPAAALSCCLGLMFGIIMWKQSALSARYYTIGWSAFLVGGLILGLTKLGLLPSNGLTENTLQVGSGIEIILLSFALAANINENRQIRSQAQNQTLHAERETRLAREEALQIQKQATEDLENKVQARTVELELLNRQLSELSDTDQLTGLKNRRYLDRILQEEFSRSSRYRHNLSIILLDIDHFKHFNDRYGHLVGDDCLKAVATVLADNIRDGIDCIARYGGEEFCVLLPETDIQCAREAAERLRRSVNTMLFKVRQNAVNVSISLGVAALEENHQSTPEKLIDKADSALYRAKQTGRNRTVIAGDESSEVIQTGQCHSGAKLG